MKDILFSVLAGLVILAFSGCAMAPEYQRPAAPVAETFESSTVSLPAPSKDDILVEDVSKTGWKDFFTDPQLQQIIETALENNRDLRRAALNIQAYQAQYRIQRSALFPSVSGTGYGLKQRTMGSTSETYSLEAAVTSWELDFFGRIRSLKEQALEQYLAMEESHKSAKLTLVAEIVKTYCSLLADRELLRISEETKKVEEESYGLIEQRVNAGIADQMDLAQAKTSLEAVKANLPLYKRQLAQDIHSLTLLVGRSLPDLLITEQRLLTDIQPIAVLPASLASSVLLQRPDIMATEHDLKAANANIGAARAAFFPTISLTAGTGFISSDLSDLFNDGSGTWSFSPSISVPIFNAGRLKAQLDAAEIQKNVYVAQYESAVQAAFREVSDALAGLETYVEQLQSQKANLDANQEYYNLARNRYQEGVDSFLTLLIAQRSLYAARQDYLTMQLSSIQNKINLYKALGGGWKENTSTNVKTSS